MSEPRITEREFAALTFRILGVVILLSGLAQALFMVPSVAQGDWSTYGIASLVGLLVSLVLLGVMGLPLIFHADAIVVWLFPKSDKTVSFSVSRGGLLMCGLALVGAWLLATNLPYLVRVAAEMIWSAEAGRRAEVGPNFLSTAAFDALGSVFACVAGWVLFRFAGKITHWWESRTRSDP